MRSLYKSCSFDTHKRASMSRDFCRAFSKVALLSASSLPMARSQTSARERGAMPLHHNSRVRGSRMTRFQSGRTCSSQRRCRVFLVSSFAHRSLAMVAALRLSRLWSAKITKLLILPMATTKSRHTSLQTQLHHPLILLQMLSLFLLAFGRQPARPRPAQDLLFFFTNR